MEKTQNIYQVWGLAAGRRTTVDAARGAFTFREYKNEIPKGDWLEIIGIYHNEVKTTAEGRIT